MWLDRVGRIALLLEAGANSISKFPAIRYFGSKEAHELERQAGLADREFKGTLTQLPELEWDKEVDNLDLDDKLKQGIKLKLKSYLRKMGGRQ